MPTSGHSVVAAESFWKDAERYLGEALLAEFVWYLANNPTAGDLIPGTGGARKIRWSRPGSGKSGGARTIYFYGGNDVPIFLIAIYAKGAKENLSDGEKNVLKASLPTWAERYRNRISDGEE